MKSNFAKKQITMLTLVLALAAAVYLNWRFAGGENVLSVTGASSGEQTQATAGEQTQPVQTDAPGTEAAQTDAQQSEPAEAEQQTETYYGDALFVSKEESSAESYFSEARLTRTSTRDEALDALQKSLQKTDLTEAEKADLTKQLTAIAKNITKEGSIESLVKAKGFGDCVAFINGESVKVVVKAPAAGLSVSEVAQIKEIVLAESGADVKNVSIVEIK
ncbi:MAG: SpoIIIAH-like family protein [Oscillospiraceae bacterium]|nr:SpoIIIAH-like family protein [Oscillospiraceae bacterium]